MPIIDPLCCGFTKICTINTFEENTILKKLLEENDWVYKTTKLKRNYENISALMVLTRCRMSTADLRTTF